MERTLYSLMLLVAIAFGASATEYEHILWPIWSSLKSDKPFMKPLEDVRVNFDRTIKFFGSDKVTVKCGDKVVAESVECEISNEKDINGFASTLIIRFGGDLLPLGKQYELCLPKGLVGWTECYSDIQILNPEHEMAFFTPADLGEPELYFGNSPRFSSELGCMVFNHPTAIVGDSKFILYREGEKIGEYAPLVENFEDLSSYVNLDFGEENIIFEKDVRYSIELPAGSLSSIYRSDITNLPVKWDFIGYYTDPALPFTYTWCSLYTDHSSVLGEVTFTYDRPVRVAEGGTVQLWEFDDNGEHMVKEVTPYINTDVNCWLLVADFGGFEMQSEVGYTIVIPDGALLSDDELGVACARSQLNVGNLSGIGSISVSGTDKSTIYNLQGIPVDNPIRGNIYIRSGKKFVYRP